jgi:nifR3 family TIM-barrel protein
MKLYRPIKIGSLELSGNLFLAPVAGYTDRAFRSICAELGASFSFTELVSAEAVYRNPGLYLPSHSKEIKCPRAGSSENLVRRGDSEKHYAIQLFGGEPESIYKAAVHLAPFHPDVLDINSGCPVPKVVKNGAGSALMKNPANVGRVVEAAVRASRDSLGNIPVTIKMRSGWDSNSLNYAECARIAVEAGAAMVSLHPRTRAQGYSGRSDWLHITDLVTRIAVPVTGSGDLYTPEDAQQMLSETGCAAVMFARGAMGNPFIFSSTLSFLETGSWEAVSFSARIAAAMRHLKMLAVDIGERAACLEMRKQFCAYTKGLVGGAVLRGKVVHAVTIAEYEQITAGFAN